MLECAEMSTETLGQLETWRQMSEVSIEFWKGYDDNINLAC